MLFRSAANGAGPDEDVDGDPLIVSAIEADGDVRNVGEVVELDTGALLTVEEDGAFVYDQNGAFADLEDGETAFDTFTYAISDGNGGTDMADVSITVTGETDDEPLNLVLGTENSDLLRGTDGADLVQSLGGRSDMIFGLGGGDVFDFSSVVDNGVKEFRFVLDFDATEDSVDLGGLDPSAVAFDERPGQVTLFAGLDDDLITLRGVESFGDIDFT